MPRLQLLHSSQPVKKLKKKHKRRKKKPALKGNGKISEAQQKRLFAISKKAGLTNDQLRTFLKDNDGIESSKDIPWQQYNEIYHAIENNDVPF